MWMSPVEMQSVVGRCGRNQYAPSIAAARCDLGRVLSLPFFLESRFPARCRGLHNLIVVVVHPDALEVSLLGWIGLGEVKLTVQLIFLLLTNI